MADNKYSILLGVELDTGDLKSQINKTKIDPIKIDFEVGNEKKVQDFVKTLKGLKVDNSSILKILNDLDKMNIKLSETNAQMKKNGDNQSLKISVKGVHEAVNGIKTVVDSVQEFKVAVAKSGDGLDEELTVNLEEPIKSSKKVSQSFKNLGKDVDVALKEINQEMTNFVKLQSKISSMQTKIDELKLVGGSENEIAFLEKELKGLETTYNELMHTFQQKLVINADILDTGDIAKFDEEIAAATQRSEKELAEFEAKLADTRAKMAKGIELKLGSDGKFATQVAKVNKDASRLSNITNDLRMDLKQLYATMDAMNLARDKGDIDGLIQSWKEYEVTLERVENQLKQAKIAQDSVDSVKALKQKQQGLSLDMDNWLKDNSAAAEKFGATIQDLKFKLESCDDVEYGNIKREFQNVRKEAKSLGLETKSLGDRLKAQFSKFSTYFSIASLFMYAEQGLRDMFEQVKAIDTAMTGLYRVTDLTSSQYDALFNDMTASAKEYGATLTDIINATSDWVRAGFDTDTSLGLAEITTMYQHISDLDYDTAAENLITAYNGFKDELTGAFDGDSVAAVGYIADILNELDNQFAVTSAGLGEALTRSASALELAGNSIQETAA